MLNKILLLSLLTLTACTTTQNRKPTQENEVKVLLRDSEGRMVEAPSTTTGKRDGKAVTQVSNDSIAQGAQEQKQAQAAMGQNDSNEQEEVAVSTPAGGSTGEVQEIKQSVSASAAQIQRMHSQRTQSGVPADTAFRYLRNGNTRFFKGILRNDGVSAQDRRRVATQQKPHAVVFASSDSSAPPEVIFDQKLGEIFVIRTPGLALDNITLEGLEYAVGSLGVNLVVVLGHDESDTIKNVLATLKGLEVATPQKSVVESLKPRLNAHLHMTPSVGYVSESWANIEGASHEIPERSALIRDAIASGEVKLVRALYRQTSGQVEWRN